jgi:hypothetical protein
MFRYTPSVSHSSQRKGSAEYQSSLYSILRFQKETQTVEKTDREEDI